MAARCCFSRVLAAMFNVQKRSQMSDQNEHIEEPPDELGIAPGTIVGGYRVERELGQGAMAVVYLATQLNLERPVALKVLTNELAHDDDFVKRFFNEAKAAGRM